MEEKAIPVAVDSSLEGSTTHLSLGHGSFVATDVSLEWGDRVQLEMRYDTSNAAEVTLLHICHCCLSNEVGISYHKCDMMMCTAMCAEAGSNAARCDLPMPFIQGGAGGA